MLADRFDVVVEASGSTGHPVGLERYSPAAQMDYVKDYFDRHAAEWVEAAYAGGTRFPIGAERMRLALEAVAPALPDGGALADLGCGGGQLCAHAARLGWKPVGVDVAPAMIEEARALTEGLPVRFVVAAFDESGLEKGSFDAVTALGLLEYLPEDVGFFGEAARLLRPGGRLAVSCRNRLYNLQSVNRYTERELANGAGDLLGELSGRLREAGAGELRELAASLAQAAPELERAAAADAAEPAPELLDHASAFTEERRQHTPAELQASAEAAGFRPVAVLALHPHPLPPGLEPLSPRVYNRLALAFQRPLEASPLGLALCTAFLGVFERC